MIDSTRARPRIVISEFMDATAVASLSDDFDVVYDATLVDRRGDLLEHVAGADALIVRNRTQVDATLLERARKLRVVGRLGVGLDNIDTIVCGARGIDVIPATGANALAVAEYVIATALLLLRGAYAVTHEVGGGRWPRNALANGRELSGKRLGLIGFGGIGRLTAHLARALGMQVMAHDAQLAPTDAVYAESGVVHEPLNDLLSSADVVSLHVPLTPETRNLIDAERLKLMKEDAILINTARGGVVDEAAVANALRARKLGGAALDVFVAEPLPAHSPLADCPNLLLTPHVAGVTRESNERVSALIAQKVAAALTGA